jgi:hypothetical protein
MKLVGIPFPFLMRRPERELFIQHFAFDHFASAANERSTLL